MTYDVLLTRENDRLFKARVLLLPDIVVTGANETDVLEQVKVAITNLRRKSRIVQLDVPSETVTDPWMQMVGIWKDDPDWDIFQEEVARYRAQFDVTTNG